MNEFKNGLIIPRKIGLALGLKARLHVKRGGTARVEMSTGSNKI